GHLLSAAGDKRGHHRQHAEPFMSRHPVYLPMLCPTRPSYCVRSRGKQCKSSARGHDHPAISRPSVGASRTGASWTSHPSNSKRISRAETPRTCALEGLLTRKSNHRITPPGLRTCNIQEATARFSSGSRIEVKTVNWLTTSNDSSGQGS